MHDLIHQRFQINILRANFPIIVLMLHMATDLVSPREVSDFFMLTAYLGFLTFFIVNLRKVYLSLSCVIWAALTVLVLYSYFSTLNNHTSDARQLSIFLLGMCLIKANTEFKIHRMYFYIVLILCLLWITVFPFVMCAGALIPVPFFRTAHPSAYAVSCIAFAALTTYFASGNLTKKQLILILTPCIGLLFAYRCRSALVGFALGYLYHTVTSSRKLKAYFVLNLLFAVLITLLLLSSDLLDSFDWNEFSSGRTNVWFERMQILKSYDWHRILFGGGAGADLFRSKQWWWAEKQSHNDFLTLTFESGVIGSSLVALFFLRLFYYGNHLQRILIIFLVANSLLNTGILIRPYFLIFFVYLYAQMRGAKNAVAFGRGFG